jgi:hypothetical protein
MTGALAPFSYLVYNVNKVNLQKNCLMNETVFLKTVERLKK